MPLREWGDNLEPIVTLRYVSHDKREVVYDTLYIWHVDALDTLVLRIRFEGLLNRTKKFRATVERLNLENEVVEEIQYIQRSSDSPISFDTLVYISLSSQADFSLSPQILRFRIRSQMFDRYEYNVGEQWDDEVVEYYTAFVQFTGDFSIDYVPITILYCPPGQDMTNAVTQSFEYGTVVSLGSSDLVGTRTAVSAEGRSGFRIQTPYYQGSWGMSQQEQGTTTENIEQTSRNTVGFGYTWSTTLIADNQRAIGRAYWGPLGDIFLLLKNPWFTLFGDEMGTSLAVNSLSTHEETEMLIVSANKLLRPNDDPVSNRIPPATRRRILELDPFIQNLDLFFQLDPNDPLINLADPNIPLERAANPYADPSAGGSFGGGLNIFGNNRATLLARYGISTGVELDLSATTDIEISDTRTNETIYYGEVSNTRGFDSSMSVLNFFEQNVSGTNTTGQSVRISYQSSHESRVRYVNTARCTLIRNQNESDLRDIEIWWDKHFSTFMFRFASLTTPSVWGSIFSLDNYLLTNQPVTLTLLDNDPISLDKINPIKAWLQKIDLIRDMELLDIPQHITMTNHLGHFDFKNIIRPGKYVLRCGNKQKRINITQRQIITGEVINVNLRQVRPILDFGRVEAWELMDALQINPKQAKRIHSELRRRSRLNRRSVSRILGNEGLSIKQLERARTLTYGTFPSRLYRVISDNAG